MTIPIKRESILLVIFLTMFFCLPYLVFGQNKKQSFDYGRKGKNHGTVSVECFLEDASGKFKKPLQEVERGEIRLDDFSEDVFFRVRFSNLVLGLKSNYQDSKKSDHNLAYSLEIPEEFVIQSPNGITSQENGVKRINPYNNDYHKGIDLVYKINSQLLDDASGVLKFKYSIVGKSGIVSGEKWSAGSVSFNYTIIPSRKFIEDKDLREKEEMAYVEIKNAAAKPFVFCQLCNNYIQNYPGVNPERMKEVTEFIETKCNTREEKETENSFWVEKILPSVESGNKDEIIKWCKEYRTKYKYEKNYTACLGLLIENLSEGEEKNEVTKSWENLTGKTYKKNKNKDLNPPSGKNKSTAHRGDRKRERVVKSDPTKEIPDSVPVVKEPDLFIPGLPMGYETPTAEMKLVSDGIVIRNANGGIPPYTLKISSSEDGEFGFAGDIENEENFKITFKDIGTSNAGNKWLRLVDDQETVMARLDNVFIKESMDLTWIYIGILGGIGFFGFQIYKKYFLV